LLEPLETPEPLEPLEPRETLEPMLEQLLNRTIARMMERFFTAYLL
jgi:hypothetical protein